MNSFYTLEKNEPIRLLQITDTHLFNTSEGELLGIKTADSFRAVLDEIQQSEFDFDLILATGDLIQDDNTEGYRYFAEQTQRLAKPTFWLEGNHDLQPEMDLLLGNHPQFHASKQILAGQHWQILLLNTQVSDAPNGRLSRGQLSWLSAKLAENPERYTLIVQHHNILPTNSAWLDQHSLRNPDDLLAVIKPYQNVKAILHGHIHQEVDSEWQGYRILSTPSTCIQFKPNHDEFTLDLLPQGWRELTLHADGSIQTEVKRLKNQFFLPNTQAKGY